MKKQISLIFAVTAVALLGGCAMFQETGQSAVVGTWTNSLGTVWTLREGGIFDVDLNKDGKPDAWGKYTVTGDTITILEASGKVPKACRVKALYHFSRTKDALQFTLVKDTCKLRMKNVLLGWHRK